MVANSVSAAVPKRLDEEPEGPPRLTALRIIKVVPGKGEHQLSNTRTSVPSRYMESHLILRQEGQP
jgi:hypothetical protein